MAIFEATARRQNGTRSNTKLVVSGGASPAGQWVTDPNLPMLFNYDYGGPGQKEVVVAKGLLVGVSPKRYKDDSIGFEKNALTVASDTVRPFGMVPYNLTKHHEDFLDGNQPSVITREYVELPWIRTAAEAVDIKWGAVYGDLAPNDLVTWSRDPLNKGKIIKWDKALHGAEDVIGQVGEIETDQEPFGWLKWAMWDESARREDQDGPVNKSGYNAPGDGGYPFDPEYTRLGKDGENGYLSQYTTEQDAQGIPGLLDGRQKAQTVQSVNFTVPAGTVDGSAVQFALGYKNIIGQSVNLFVDGVQRTPSAIDVSNGSVTILTEAGDVGKSVNIQFRAEFFGTPAGWDHKGAVGVARILLKF